MPFGILRWIRSGELGPNLSLTSRFRVMNLLKDWSPMECMVVAKVSFRPVSLVVTRVGLVRAFNA